MALSDVAGLTLSGVRWPLERFDLSFGSSRTLSNAPTGVVRASIEAGRAIVLHGPGDHGPSNQAPGDQAPGD